jgi:catechol 2,3-dioxygenase-like lactoylglutathione lyase family enzyme
VFDHVTIGASDREASRRFYRVVLAKLGLEPNDDPAFVEWGDFSIAQAGEGRPVTTRLHVGFAAPSREHVDAFWRAGVDAGHRDDGPPGPRPEYGPDYYGGFLLDPDGNSVEAVHRGDLRAGSGIDHLWWRVADRAASRRFYATIAPHAGFRVAAELADRTRYAFGPNAGAFSIVDGPPTAPFHLAFAAPDRAAVERFHRAATAAGHPDNGAPGERARYRPGSYGAFVLDPDGHNVEAVHHAR